MVAMSNLNGVKKLLTALFLTCAGCSRIDHRNADVIIEDEELRSQTEFAVQFWHDATDGDVDLHITDTCETSRCYYVHLVDVSDLPKNADGWTTGLKSGDADIAISNDALKTDENLNNSSNVFTNATVAHELGHAMGLGHVKVPNELMSPVLSPFGMTACTGPATRAEYQNVFGVDALREVCVNDCAK